MSALLRRFWFAVLRLSIFFKVNFKTLFEFVGGAVFTVFTRGLDVRSGQWFQLRPNQCPLKKVLLQVISVHPGVQKGCRV